MRLPELAIRLKAVDACFEVALHALAILLNVDKTTVWRWFQVPTNLPEAKEIRLVQALCQWLGSEKGVFLTEEDFRINNTLDFCCLKLGLSKQRAAEICGIRLPIPEVLVESALASQEPLTEFVGVFFAYWARGEHDFAVARVRNIRQANGQVTFELSWDGGEPFSVTGYLYLANDQLTVIGDRLAHSFGAKPTLFTMPMQVEYNSRQRVMVGLQGHMPEWRGSELIMHRVALAHCSPDEYAQAEAEGDGIVSREEVVGRLSRNAMRFLDGDKPRAALVSSQ